MTNIRDFTDEELKAETERREKVNRIDLKDLNLWFSGSIHYSKKSEMFVYTYSPGREAHIFEEKMYECFLWLSKFFPAPAPNIDLSDIDWELIDSGPRMARSYTSPGFEQYITELRKLAERVKPLAKKDGE